MQQDSAATFNKYLAKSFLYALLALFLLPAVSYLFVSYGLSSQDAAILAVLDKDVDKGARLHGMSPLETKAYVHAHPPSSVCGSVDEAVAMYRDVVCERYGELWQFHVVQRVSFWALVVGLVVLLGVAALGVLALLNRNARYLSVLAGWRLLTAVCAAEVVVQGGLLVWLSFWGTAFFFQRYFVKLVALAGIGVAIAVFYAVVCIFKRPPRSASVDGELLDAAQAPALWAHVRDSAARLQTRAPDQIVAGIDVNFFVTEAPMAVGEQAVSGRTLFISLPLLRLLNRGEADAVLAHELAHLQGGDTASSAALGPLLVRYDMYCNMMHAQGVTRPAFHLLNLYRLILEFALTRESRAREFRADRMAAGLVNSASVVRALVKVAAYAQYRSEIERELFDHRQAHAASLGIAQYVATGLAHYAASDRFLAEMKSANVPHPFDSHPPLTERMANVGHQLEAHEFSSVVHDVPRPYDCWVADIQVAEEIEARLWAAYERQFAQAHERSLAYRYQPAGAAEEAVVLKYFPPVSFQFKKGQRVVVTYAGLILSDQALSWDSVRDLKYENGIGGDVLQVVHPEKGWLGSKTTKVKLPGIGKQREQFKAVLGHYWQRHQYMTAQLKPATDSRAPATTSTA